MIKKQLLLSFFVASIIFIPYIIIGKGMFVLPYDYYVQQIPFNILSNEAIHSKNIFWNWNLDLGVNFIGGMSFYVIGSPFFWLTLFFDSAFVPYLLGPLFILKFVVASITASLFMKKYTNKDKYAILGGLLYAFSGYMINSILFNHFIDAAALFPLMVWGMDEMLDKKKHLPFVIAVALNAMTNYFFFVAEVILLIIYFICRYYTKNWKHYILAAINCILSGILGLGIAGIVFIPSVVFIFNNPKTIYKQFPLLQPLRSYLQIIKEFILPADAMHAQMLFYDSEFHSMECWLPMIGSGLVFIWLWNKRKNWMSILLLLFSLFLISPKLNAVLYINTETYERWIYIIALFLALVSVKVIENLSYFQWKTPMILYFIGVLIFLCTCIIYKKGHWIINFKEFCVYGIIGLTGCIITLILLALHNKKDIYYAWAICISIFAILSTSANIANYIKIGSVANQTAEVFEEQIKPLAKRLNNELDSEGNYRIKTEQLNLSCMSGIPETQSFSSIYTPSVYYFSQLMGINKEVLTNFPDRYEGVKYLLSEKYSVKRNDTLQQNEKLFNTLEIDGKSVYIIEKLNMPGIGFGYNNYMTKEAFQSIPVEKRHLVLMETIIIDKEDEAKVGKYLTKKEITDEISLTEERLFEEINKRNNMSVENFRRNFKGFSAEYKSLGDNICFFSVPYDKGWSAYINGKEVEIIKATEFMGVLVEEGIHHIEFKYKTPGFVIGLISTVISTIGLIIIEVYKRKYGRRI